MKLLFDQIEEEVIAKMRGGEGFLAARRYIDDNNKIMMGRLEPGSTIGLHTHETDSEIIYVLSGSGKVLYDGEFETLTAGDCHYCPQGHQHSLINDSQEPLAFLAVIPQHAAHGA